MSTSFGATETQGDVGMTLRAVISACCGVFVLLAPAQARGVECATEPQRKIEIEKLNESVDWFLSIVEEVPEGHCPTIQGRQTARRRECIPSGSYTSPVGSTQDQRGRR
jgi:hypothetical protein